MKNIVILGAGLMQKPAILSAKQLGFHTIVVDADPKAVCIPQADEFFQIDLKDREGILELCKRLKNSAEGLEGVFTAGTDFSASVSYVCEKLGLSAHSFEAAVNASVKTQMRACFEKEGVPSPKFIRAGKTDVSDALLNQVLSKMDFPFVVKPVDNMGARGCRMVRTKEEFLPAVKIACECSRTGYSIIEEYMDGPEFSIDALVYNGKFIVTGFAIRHIKYAPYFIEIGHTMPADIPAKMHDELISVFALGAKAEGLTCGAAKADIKYTKNGPMIGEIAARLSGGYMSGWTYPYASDLNLTEQGILIATGNQPSKLLELAKPVQYTPSELCKNLSSPYELFEVPCVRTSAERAWMSIPGTVEYIENIKEYTDKAVFDVLPRATVSIGSHVDFPRNNVEKCGNIIAVSHDRATAIKAAEDAVSNVFITLKPNTKETDDYLAGLTQSDEENFPPDAFGKLTKNQLDELHGEIAADTPVAPALPDFLNTPEYQSLTDWNFNTIKDTLCKFDILRAKHPALNKKDFFKALMRGGIQAAVYYSDSIKAGKK
ncbi:MAG: ATP-grasp domain-containing protein [Treponema sp.]|nr:ATP-grasp domain-containing protein [Treponema sp.]